MRRVNYTILLGLCTLLVAGCPASAPLLSVSPRALSFGDTSTRASFTVSNLGGGTLDWALEMAVPWLSPDRTTGSVQKGLDRVTFTADRSGLSPGTYQGTVTVRAADGQDVAVGVSMVVPGTPSMTVSPAVITLPLGSLRDGPEAEITIGNTGDDVLIWNVALRDPQNPARTIPFPASLEVTPAVGNTPPGGQSIVEVDVIEDELDTSRTNSFTLVVQSSAGSREVGINIGAASSARIGVTTELLEFGPSVNQQTFSVYNAGAAGSELAFSVTSDRPGLLLIDPVSGRSTGVGGGDNISEFDLKPISVTVNRGALRGAQDGGVITVRAPGLEPVDILVRVEAAPLTFEGAINRSRPPFVLRFVFLLRDGTGEALDTTRPDVLAEVAEGFRIFEDGKPLDLDETSSFITGPEGLKYNLALLLDYTGSMYNAPPGGGGAIEQMVQASKSFVNNLPEGYRLALLEYHERQQAQRLIHGFTTDRQALTDALEAFSIPVADHGASEVYDAVIEACIRLANEDATALPFDDADVRALVFISDGRDTSSVATLQEAIDTARDARVRLYPIGFGANPNENVLIQMASQTGGHYYAAPTAAHLVTLLEQDAQGPAGNPGRILTELRRQLVLTYVSLFQEGSHTYLIETEYQGLRGSFQEDAVFAIGGDVRAGQLALRTTGIGANRRARMFVRTDYVPRNVTQFRFRFISDLPYELEPIGLIEDWTVVDEGGGVFTVLTTEDDFLPYGAFGNLLELTFDDVPVDRFTVGFRHDNRILVNPPFTKFFQYPFELEISNEGSSQATVPPILLEERFDPDDPFAWDLDLDGVSDFDDLFPEDPERF